MYSHAHQLPRQYRGPPLTRTEAWLLLELQERRAVRCPATLSDDLRTLLTRGLVFLRPSVVGDILTLGYAGCHLLQADAASIPSVDRAANLIYYRDALTHAQERGYLHHHTYSTGRAMLERAPRERHLMLARVTRGGYSRMTVREQLKRTDILIHRGSVIVVAPDCQPYASLAAHHSHLQLWPLAPQGTPTTACKTPEPAGTHGRSALP
ncbi:hypothetical protein [Deinococcus ruber]|uniref:hypothetical protein n=1 Tax=Deinococcus ruber TaxID=1848197 RepID=UPI00166EFEB6|nr:hypothetical protein [Deinococcus ruber]